MKLYCHECLQVFDDANTVVQLEYHPEVTAPNYERFATSPCCRSSYGEAVECELCHCWFAPDNMIGSVCKGCVEDNMDQATTEAYIRDDLYYFADWLVDRVKKKG